MWDRIKRLLSGEEKLSPGEELLSRIIHLHDQGQVIWHLVKEGPTASEWGESWSESSTPYHVHASVPLGSSKIQIDIEYREYSGGASMVGSWEGLTLLRLNITREDDRVLSLGQGKLLNSPPAIKKKVEKLIRKAHEMVMRNQQELWSRQNIQREDEGRQQIDQASQQILR